MNDTENIQKAPVDPSLLVSPVKQRDSVSTSASFPRHFASNGLSVRMNSSI